MRAAPREQHLWMTRDLRALQPLHGLVGPWLFTMLQYVVLMQEVVTLTEEGNIGTSTYADLHRRSQLCALALQQLGVRCAELPCLHSASFPAAADMLSCAAFPAGTAMSWQRWRGTPLGTLRCV